MRLFGALHIELLFIPSRVEEMLQHYLLVTQAWIKGQPLQMLTFQLITCPMSLKSMAAGNRHGLNFQRKYISVLEKPRFCCWVWHLPGYEKWYAHKMLNFLLINCSLVIKGDAYCVECISRMTFGNFGPFSSLCCAPCLTSPSFEWALGKLCRSYWLVESLK